MTAKTEAGIKPRAWTLQRELDAGESTCRAHLWFSDPVNSSWEPLYDQAAIDAAVAAERERCARVCEGIGAGHTGAARRLDGQDATHAAGMRDGSNQCAAAIRAEAKGE